jgi:diketogulonate reductase-like aldo/keto reductase
VFRHIDSAQAYRNEEAVGQAVKESGLNREDIFISAGYLNLIDL